MGDPGSIPGQCTPFLESRFRLSSSALQQLQSIKATETITTPRLFSQLPHFKQSLQAQPALNWQVARVLSSLPSLGLQTGDTNFFLVPGSSWKPRPLSAQIRFLRLDRSLGEFALPKGSRKGNSRKGRAVGRSARAVPGGLGSREGDAGAEAP